MKEKSWKEQQTEVQRGRKRYLARLEQTREANKEIDDFSNTNVDDSERGANDRGHGKSFRTGESR